MVSINYAFREISCKIVYYGPGLSGKTTNLQYVHDRVPAKSRGDLISLATEADRTLYFDFLPIHVGDIGGFSTKFQLYTVPGQVFYNATRKLVLRGVDGIVFVADSQQAKMDENIESLANMYENLRENDIDPKSIPLVFQYNKRDLPDICTVEELEKTLNTTRSPFTEACAVRGQGVFDTMKRITKMVLEDTRRKTSSESAAMRTSSASSEVDVMTSSGPVSTLPTPHRDGRDSRWDASRQGVGAAVAEETAVQDSSEVGVDGTSTPVSSRSAGGRMLSESKLPASIIAAQKSTRIRRRHRSLFDRLFGWLLGR